MYRRTQFGWAILAITLPLAALLALVGIIILHEIRTLLLIPAILALLILLLFKDLTVEVDDREIRVWFGRGLIRKTILISDLSECSAVQQPWYAGWGIRLGKDYTVFSVSGTDTVELSFRDGRRKFRIGTDDPDGLVDAIRSRMNKLE